jgi:hypothetical protein
MQKVVGSSPIIRFRERSELRGFLAATFRPGDAARSRVTAHSRSVPLVTGRFDRLEPELACVASGASSLPSLSSLETGKSRSRSGGSRLSGSCRCRARSTKSCCRSSPRSSSRSIASVCDTRGGWRGRRHDRVARRCPSGPRSSLPIRHACRSIVDCSSSGAAARRSSSSSGASATRSPTSNGASLRCEASRMLGAATNGPGFGSPSRLARRARSSSPRARPGCGR